MAYQHVNRLTAHWQPKSLSTAAKLVAKHLAENIQHEGTLAGRFYHSAELIAAELGLGKKTAYRAIEALLEAKVFEAEVLDSHRRTGLRTYSLSIDCPPDCKALATHYTPLELAAKGNPETYSTSQNDHSNTPTTSQNDHPYKELFNKDIDIDIKNSPSLDFEKLQGIYLQTIRTTLENLDSASANHLLLKACLEARPDLVAIDALRVAEQATTSPEAYLAKTTRETPESLLKASRASLQTEQEPTSKEWPADLESVLVANALDIAGTHTEQGLYDEYLLGSGAIPSDLVAIAEARGMNYLSLTHLVADCRSIAYGLEFRGFDPDSVSIDLGDYEQPLRADFGSDLIGYNEACELWVKRENYRAAFDQKQADLVEAWLSIHSDADLTAALDTAQIEALETERLANPELQADPEHYARLITNEIRHLPQLDTLTEYLSGVDHLQSVTLPQLRTEFEAFWNAYPSRPKPEAKGRKIVALKAWCEARKTKSHAYLMQELGGSFFGTDPSHIPFPATWLNDTASASEVEIKYLGRRL